MPDTYASRRSAGLGLYMFGVLSGLALLFLLFLITPLASPDAQAIYLAMVVGALFAFPAGAVYLTVPRLLDRYDPEPWYALVGCLIWGGVAACGYSAVINSLVGGVAEVLAPGSGDAVSAVVSAPIVEEFFKGLGVFGVFYFLRNEFDGVLDGIIYATFVALGFATIENVIYYAQAAMEGEEVLAGTFFLRGLCSPWVHPVFTAMTGIGFGIARERSGAITFLAPLGGLAGAVFLHFVWNATATFANPIIVFLLLPLWAIFVLGFLIIIVVLVRRFGRTLRENLVDEVALGTIDQRELELVCSAFGLLRARLRHGKRGEEFVRATARLGLSKWHTARAMKSRHQTVSMDFIVPLRRRIAELKAGL